MGLSFTRQLLIIADFIFIVVMVIVNDMSLPHSAISEKNTR